MPDGNFTVLFETGAHKHKLTKIIFSKDGSYHVAVPYHPAKKAFLVKQTLNYTTSVPADIRDETLTPLEEAIDIASADDKRVKLTHHVSGLVHFSGEGVVSGWNSDGTPKGIGIKSWPLTSPCPGPAFAVAIQGVEAFDKEDNPKGQCCIFRETEITPIPGATGLILEGYYFPPMWRRFVVTSADGSKTLSIVHPTGNVLRLRVLLAPEQCHFPGFIGLELYTCPVTIADATSGFLISGPTENVRKNEKGEKLGDGIMCCYPRPNNLPVRRSLDYESKTTPAAPGVGGESTLNP